MKLKSSHPLKCIKGLAPYQILRDTLLTICHARKKDSLITGDSAQKFGMGFSLIEIMIVILIFSIVLGATYSVLTMGNSSFQSGDTQITVQQEARKAMNKIVTELREASSVNLGDSYPFTIWSQKIKYEISNNQLQRTVEGETPSVLANNVGSIQFSLPGNNVVYITLVTQKNTVSGRTLSATLTSQVKIRN